MTEQQIRDGFQQLEDALAPPADTLERVDRRVRSRRRRRRTAMVSVVAVLAAGCLGTAVALSGGDDGGDLVANDPGPSALVLTRPDGSTYTFSDVTVTCEPPPFDEDSAGQERIYAYNARVIEHRRLTDPWLYFSALLDEVGEERTFEFPNDWSMSTEELPMILFVADSVGEPEGNEASTDVNGRGTVRVLEAACDPTPVLRLAVDADLGSELGMGTLHVSGGLG